MIGKRPTMMAGDRRGDRDFDRGPMIVFYEVTRACDLVCLHCRACAQRIADPNELTTGQARRLIDALTRFPEPPMLVLTGGDPLKRRDIFELIEYAVASGLETAITPSATPLVTADAVRRLKGAGIARMAVSLDGADATTHDRMRGVPGSFDHTRRIMAAARSCGLPLQVNTTLTVENLGQIEAMAALLEGERIVLWSVFYLVPVGRATTDLRLSAEQCEGAFERLWEQATRSPFPIKTTEAPHYRRFVLQRRKADPGAPAVRLGTGGTGRRPLGINDGKGIMFISHAGLIHPSGFMPMVCGMFPFNDPVDVYERSPVFRRLRDADQLGGKCGVCEFRHVCGGSRARAMAVSGDPYAAEPDCAYRPKG
jgi:radical SAM protein